MSFRKKLWTMLTMFSPATYFLERKDISGVKWALDGSIYLSDPQLTPPKDCDARHDVWILLEILRRAFSGKSRKSRL